VQTVDPGIFGILVHWMHTKLIEHNRNKGGSGIELAALKELAGVSHSCTEDCFCRRVVGLIFLGLILL
jgi:hypothetical protein